MDFSLRQLFSLLGFEVVLPNQGVLDKFFLKKRDDSQMDEQSALPDATVTGVATLTMDLVGPGAWTVELGSMMMKLSQVLGMLRRRGRWK